MNYIGEIKKGFETNLKCFNITNEQDKIESVKGLIASLEDLEKNIETKTLNSNNIIVLKNLLEGVGCTIDSYNDTIKYYQDKIKADTKEKEELITYLSWN